MAIDEYQDDAVRAATALIEWCRRQAADDRTSLMGHIDENERFVLKALLEEFDRANAMEAVMDVTGAAAAAGETMFFVYRNYRGEVSMREVRTPVVTYFGATEWHPEKQWLVMAYDVVKEEMRSFALRDMRFLHQLYDGLDG